MKLESESDGMHQGLDGIQSLGFRHTELLATKASMYELREQVSTGDGLQVL